MTWPRSPRPMGAPLRGRLRFRPALATAPIILLLWIGLGVYLMQKYRADLAGAERDSRNLTHAFEENIRRSIEAIDTTIRAARVARAHDPAHFDLRAWERDSGLTRDLTLQLAMTDRLGSVTDSNLTSQSHVSIADRPHFIGTRDQAGDSLLISRPVIGRVSGRWSVQFVRKLFDPTGDFDGVIVASLDPAFLARFYATLDVGHGALLLLGSDGIVRASAPPDVANLSADLSPIALVQAGSSGSGTFSTSATKDGLERVFSRRRLDPYGLTVAVGLSTADALTDYRRDFRSCIALGILLSLGIMLVSAALSRNRQEVMKSREILRAAVDNISQGLLVVDSHRMVPVLNARAAELLELPVPFTRPGVSFDAVLQWQVQNGEFEGPDAAKVRNLVSAGGLRLGTSVYRRTRRNGKVLEVRTKALDTGLAVRTITDITEPEQHACKLAEARDAAEAAARARAEFLAVMSHEIRTPLNGVIGIAQLLESMTEPEEQRGYVRLIRKSGLQLLTLVNDILDFSRLEASRVQLEDIGFDPREVLEGVVSLMFVQASAKSLVLSASVADDVPPSVTGDPGRLRQVLLNLVGNAIKFTDRGWVRLSLGAESAEGGLMRLMFQVADSGIGIAPDAIERMFQEFTQVDGSISRRFGGSGLGLAICRRLVELMGGTISATSRPGEGSIFRFDVTLLPGPKLLPAESAGEPEAVELPPLRILLTEDNAINRVVALRLLERSGHRVDVAGTGAEAITAVTSGSYDLVLMDVMMPEMDGLTATRRIREGERSGLRLPIIGLTAGTNPETIEACFAAGMDAVTSKPVTASRLSAAMAEGLRRTDYRWPEREPRPADGTPDADRPAGADADAVPPVRLADLHEAFGEDVLEEILCTFVEDAPLLLAAIRDAAERGDREILSRSAHSLTGAARNIGAAALAERAARVEADASAIAGCAIAANGMRRDGEVSQARIAALAAALDVVLHHLQARVLPREKHP